MTYTSYALEPSILEMKIPLPHLQTLNPFTIKNLPMSLNPSQEEAITQCGIQLLLAESGSGNFFKFKLINF